MAQLIGCDPDEVVLGGGNAELLGKLPRGCHLGDNANAFVGGFRAWERGTPWRHKGGKSARRRRSRIQRKT